MASDGTGTGWDNTSPADAEFVKDGAKEIRDLRKGVEIRSNKEHVTLAASSVGGEHLQGSAKTYFGGSAPTKRPDTTTNLGGTDAGRLWNDGGVLKSYNGTAWVSLSASLSYSIAVIGHQTSAGASGGSISSGSWVTRPLTTELSDPSSIVSISSNTFTLGAGTYEINADSPIYAGDQHQSRLFNVSGSATAALGTCEHASSSSPQNQTSSKVITIISPTGTTAYRIEHRVSVNAQFGHAPSSAFGVNCIFGTVTIRKLA